MSADASCGMSDRALGPTPRIDAGELVLSPLRVDEAAEMVDVLAGDALYTFTGGSPPTEEVLRSRYEMQVRGPGADGEAWHNWIVRDGGRPVGYVQATVTGHVADVAWVIGLAWQRRAFARRAAIAMCEWLRAAGIERLTAHIRPDHRASIRVAEACGLEPTDVTDDDGERIWSWTRTRAESN